MTANAEYYFQEEMKKVYIDYGNKLKSFQEYLNHRYRDACYTYSAYAIMGLKKDDCLLRGTIDLPDWKSYEHGWVEFTFSGEEYVFDSQIKGVIPKETWYSFHNPKITFKKSQKEILDMYLNDTFAYKISNSIYNFWQLKYYLMEGYVENVTEYDDLHAYNVKEGYLPTLLKLARINTSCYDETIVLFIASHCS